MIINTGRGALIETKAVVNALKKRKIAGLAIGIFLIFNLDVYE